MRTMLVALCGFGMAVPVAPSGSNRSFEITISNPLAAFSSESNAHARYVVLAEKADVEGCAGIASLFRTAAPAEELHAANHASVIRGIGDVPAPNQVEPAIDSTRANLEAALKDETCERDEIYPLIRQAASKGNSSVVRTVKFASARKSNAPRVWLYLGDRRVEGLPDLRNSEERFEQVK